MIFGLLGIICGHKSKLQSLYYDHKWFIGDTGQLWSKEVVHRHARHVCKKLQWQFCGKKQIGQVMKTDPGSVQVTGGLAPFRAHAGDSLSSDSSELWINFRSLSVCLYVFRGMMKQFWVQVWSDVITKICYWPFIISPPHLVPYKSAIILYRCLKCISYHHKDTIFGTVPTFLYLAAKDFLIFTGTLCPWLVHESWW